MQHHLKAGSSTIEVMQDLRPISHCFLATSTTVGSGLSAQEILSRLKSLHLKDRNPVIVELSYDHCCLNHRKRPACERYSFRNYLSTPSLSKRSRILIAVTTAPSYAEPANGSIVSPVNYQALSIAPVPLEWHQRLGFKGDWRHIYEARFP